ncbi:T9SS type A sorting domain-containing protein [Carboxylicivirga sp. M1479]|uniref:T9SS type A sorting domain-containing protein n=1 Tax=Carboxylicivirga sp. M1479 TaxID=2594476 RepID=UPI001178817B|nr:T9SS type A sorting domain-containing protein [Carboxylicivirga sp. M1479]TRX72668.1 T9SS type A sorting domain-containing protein [Carboxylicivirga sp. M1479]
MKKTTTILIGAMAWLSINAQEVTQLSKRTHFKKQTEKQTQLKAVQAEYRADSKIVDYWDGSQWLQNDMVSLQYYGNGNLHIEEGQYHRLTYQYDDENRVSELISESHNGVAWENSSKSEWAYDEAGDQSLYITSNWENGAWVIQYGSRFDRVYDSNGNDIEEISFSYNTSTPGWEEQDGYKTEYIMSNGLVDSEIEYYRENGAWMEESKIEWSYNVDDEIDGGMFYSYDMGAWVLDARVVDVDWLVWLPNLGSENVVSTYTFQAYDGSGDVNDDASYENSEKMLGTYPEGTGSGMPPVTVETYQTWTGSAWVDDSRWTYEDKSDYESYLDEEWNGSAWIKTYLQMYDTDMLAYNLDEYYTDGVMTGGSKYSSTYDTFDNLLEEKNENYTNDAWEQQGGMQYVYTYEGATSKVLIKVHKAWSVPNSQYENQSRETFSYVSTNLEQSPQISIKVYPTTFNSFINVEVSQRATIAVYSLTGVKVTEGTVMSGSDQLDLSGLSKGCYVLKVDAGKEQKVIKVFKN